MHTLTFDERDMLSIYDSLMKDANPLADALRESHNGVSWLEDAIASRDHQDSDNTRGRQNRTP